MDEGTKYEYTYGWIAKVRRLPMAPLKVHFLTPQERAELFADIANGTVKEAGLIGGEVQMTAFHRMDRSESGRVEYFHYWLMTRTGGVFKVGSGGYIPLLHSDPKELVYEFELKQPFGQPVKTLEDE